MKLLLPVFVAYSAVAASVWTGVYSKDQAERGRKIYNAQCARCHGEGLLGGEGSPPLVDKDFLEKWTGKSAGELVELTRKTMPSDGPGLFNAGPGAGGKMFRAIDKKTGAIVHEFGLPASTTGVPMTYMVNDRQYIVVATGARGTPAELVALAIP